MARILRGYIRAETVLHVFSTPVGFTAIALAALAGVILYRLDKKYRWTWPMKSFANLFPLVLLLLFDFFNIGPQS